MPNALTYRLAHAKRVAAANVDRRAQLLRNYPGAAESFLDSLAPLDWRVIAQTAARKRYGRPAIWNPPYTDSAGNVWRWLETVDGSGLRVAVDNATSRVSDRRTLGYYVDTFADESQHGVVLATRDCESPRARFFPAINDPHNDGAFRILWKSCDNWSDAAHTADSLAERDAESQRDYDSAWQAGSQWADLGAQITAARKEALAILRDRKSASGSATLCAVIREKVESLLSDIRAAREKRAQLANGDAESFYFYTGDARLRAAFNEGAGRLDIA